MKKWNLIVLTITALMGCSGKNMDDVIITTPVTPIVAPPAGNGTALTYLALGDSYTIGESVPADQSFPYQLASALNKQEYSVSAPIIIARTGWTTDELIREVNNQNLKSKFDIVTLLIGVNNQYRHYNIDTYRTEFVQLLNTALSYANGNKKRVFVLSIPNWGVTPFAKGQDVMQITREIAQYNAINKEETDKAGVSYTDITPISQQAIADASLVAADGLHPSGKMYMLWTGLLSAEVLKNLK
jgi:lysophospholipase L1-like esterase